MTTKTPAMILNEICSKMGTGPLLQFQEMRDADGITPIFEATCTVSNFGGNNYTAVAKAKKKQTAKQNACDLMLREHLKIFFSEPEVVTALLDTPQQSASNSVEAVDTISKEFGGVYIHCDSEEILKKALEGNPISDLAVLCNEKDFDPIYLEEPMHGQSHCPLFVVRCSAGSVELAGTSKKKQFSKRIAAYKVLVALKELEVLTGDVDMAKDEVEALGPRGVDDVFRLVDVSGEVSKERDGLFIKSRKPCNFNINVEECRNNVSHNRHDYQRMKGGPLLEELLKATENMAEEGFSHTKMKNFIKRWAADRDGGIVTFVEGLRKELQFSFDVSPLEAVGNEESHRSEAELLNEYIGTQNNFLVSIEVAMEKSGEVDPRLPFAVGFGSTQQEAFENAAEEIVFAIAILCRGVTLGV